MKQLRLEKGLIHTSGKMVLLDKLLPKLKSEGHKVNIDYGVECCCSRCWVRGEIHIRLEDLKKLA